MAYKNPTPGFDDLSEFYDEAIESDYTEIKQVYFAFIDVLGFKKTFDDIRISKERKSADKYREVFNYYFELMNSAKFMEDGKSTGCYAGQTSDSLYFYTERPDFLFEFIKLFSHFNLYAMSKNVFFRGGIAKGNLFKKEDHQFYGDSVICAYLLESVISKNPIIMIDKNTHEDMLNVQGYDEFVAINNNRQYIKPFELLNKDIPFDIMVYREVDIGIVQKIIEENKRYFEFDANNYSKYIFLFDELKKSNNTTLNGIE